MLCVFRSSQRAKSSFVHEFKVTQKRTPSFENFELFVCFVSLDDLAVLRAHRGACPPSIVKQYRPLIGRANSGTIGTIYHVPLWVSKRR